MKNSGIDKIVVLFDFSDCSRNALSYALDLAQETGSEIYLLHTFDFRGSGSSMDEHNSSVLMMKEELLIDMDDVVQSLLKSRSTTVHQYCKHGSLSGETQKLADRIGADLIIMGTYSQNALKRMVLGSSTIEILEELEYPVLVVPPNYRFKGIRKVCFTTNYHSGSITAMHRLQHMLAPLKPGLSLLHFECDARSAHRKNTFLKLVGDDPALENVPVHDLQADSLLVGVSDYTRKNPVDLMAMANKKRTGLRKMFTTSPEEEAIYTRVPLLILPRSSVMIDIGLEDSELL